MPHGKPAGVRCVQLSADDRCQLFSQASRPAVCASLQPESTMCGSGRETAFAWLAHVEHHTAPAGGRPD